MFSATSQSVNFGAGEESISGFYVRCVRDFKLLNPNPSVVSREGIIDPTLNGLDTTKVVNGAAADGLTKLLLYLHSNVPVTFQVTDLKDGSLKALTDNGDGTTTVTINPDAQGRVIAIYTAPDGIGDAGNNTASRHPAVKATFNNNPVDTLSISLQLITPPVVLIHGMWSKPAVWTDFKNYLITRGFVNIVAADYHQANYKTFNPQDDESMEGRAAVKLAIDSAMKYYNNTLKIACSQVDIVGHSLGGLMARSFAQQPAFFDVSNYAKGYIHKLITLATPHRGSPYGPELWNHQNDIKWLPEIGFFTLKEAMALSGNIIGTCHRDFGIQSAGIIALGETLPFKTLSVTGNAAGTAGELVMNVACLWAFYKTFNSVMASNCTGYDPLPNDLIVPESSQLGFLPGQGKELDFIYTAHSSPPGSNTETNSPFVQEAVANKLLSNNSSDFGIGYPAPSNLPLNDCTTPNELVAQGSNNNTSGNRVVPTKEHARTGNQSIVISSPVRGALYQSGTSTNITFSFDAINGAVPTAGMFMVQGVGWFAVSSTPTYSVTVNLPADASVGKLHIIAMAVDSSGISLADTSSISIAPQGTLQSITVDPASIQLDSVIHQSAVHVEGTYQTGTGTITADLTSSGTGTVYAVKKTTVCSVNGEGLVVAIAAGTDTLIISNGGMNVKIPVTVTNNFKNATYFANTIDFPAIADKVVGSDPFGLDATASSGEDVIFSLVSGPATVSNGIVVLNGTGTVTIQATSKNNAYFKTPSPVTQSFNIVNALPLNFVSFTGSLILNDASLQWQTAQELNTSYFIIERSTDAVHFNFVNKLAAAGNTSSVTNYVYTDKSIDTLAASRIYYRLKEVDLDGKINMSNVVIINTLPGNGKIIVYPNPSKKVINLLFPQTLGTKAYFNVYDMTGKLILQQKLTTERSQQYIFNTVSAGNYKIIFWNNDQVIGTESLIIAP